MRTVFITGINRGLGRHLAEQVLEAGGRVAGTTRDLRQIEDLRSDRLLPLSLDLTDFPAIDSALEAAFQAFGRIDAVISNAGYSLMGAAEELSYEAMKHILDTNLLGSIWLARAAVPRLRAQGGGRIIQVSSSSGQTGFPGLSLYCASKWGIEGFFESLAPEVAPFGIETTLVEPGAIRTRFADTGVISQPLAVYQGTPAHHFRELLSGGFVANGDPARMARAILASLEQTPAPARLVLGSDAYAMLTTQLSARLQQVQDGREIAYSTDYAAP